MIVLMSDFISLLDCYRFRGGHHYAWSYLCLISLVYLIIIGFAELFMVVLVSDFISLLDCYRFCGVQMYWNVLCMVVLVSDFIS